MNAACRVTGAPHYLFEQGRQSGPGDFMTPAATTRLCLSTALLASLCMIPAAHAQSAPEESEASWAAGTIVVTGERLRYAAPTSGSSTRTDTPLIEVPQSVQVVTRALLQEQDRRTLGDALVNVSGVTPTRSDEALFIPPVLRGFPAEVYLDGLPIFAGNQQAYDPTSLAGVERIEVLKGPSATLYGGGLGTPLGGIINIQTVRPTDQAGGYGAMRAGSYSTWNPYGDINVPLAPGIAARVSRRGSARRSTSCPVLRCLRVMRPRFAHPLASSA